MIEAVVFDLDGVLLDTEEVWDEARRQIAAERGAQWPEDGQRAMMGMSSPEWSRYMHEVVGLAEPPEEISAEVVARLEALYRERLPLIDGAIEAVRRIGSRRPLAIASSSNRPLINLFLELTGTGDAVRGDRVVRRGRAREARAGCLPRGGSATAELLRRPARRSRTRRTGSARPTRPACTWSRSRTASSRRARRRSRSRTSSSSRSTSSPLSG